MPVCKAEAHRALELLEDYYSKLDDANPELKSALEQVIKVFKSRLFQALLDIQEFYDLTLMDQDKVAVAKAADALALAHRWEATERPFPAGGASPANNNSINASSHIASFQMLQQQPPPQPFKEGEDEEIVLERGTYGLGFSIAGGVDNPHAPGETSIYVTKLIPGGAAAVDGRLGVGDVITRVNDVDVVDVTHAVAVEALKKAGNRVALLVKRGRPSSQAVNLVEVTLSKGPGGLGFTIAGGIGNQHIPGDNGIYVTKVMEGGVAAMDGRIDVGDRIVSIKNFPTGEFILDSCTHEDAVAGLRKCKDKVVLSVAKADIPYTSSPTIVQMQPMVVGHFQPLEKQVGPDLATPRKTVLMKSPAGLGFNIVGGEDGEGIFISYILPGGPAEKSGAVFRGDKILGVNNVNLTQATHEAAAEALKSAGEKVALHLLYSPEDYERFETKIQSIKSHLLANMARMAEPAGFFVRALFDNPHDHGQHVPGRMLKFSFGDILHVLDASDGDWWRAQHVDPRHGHDLGVGLIPSRTFWEKTVGRIRRDSAASGGGGGMNGQWTSEESGISRQQQNGEKSILSYEVVQQAEINYARPVIVLGPLKDRINDELISEFPERFSSCVPHTTRQQRQFEVDGRDYHFVQSREQMEQDIKNHKFIEAGQYNNNLYGTSIASVKQVAEGGKHCILDVSGNAIKRLQSARLFPIAVFVRPSSPSFIHQMTGGTLTEEQCRKAYGRAKRMEGDFLQCFTAVVQGDSFDDIYNRVKALIGGHAGRKIWVPANEMF